MGSMKKEIWVVVVLLIVVSTFLWSLLVPVGPLYVKDTEPRIIQIGDEAYDVEIPSEYVQLPTWRTGLPLRKSLYVQEDTVAEQIADILLDRYEGISDKSMVYMACKFVRDNIRYESDFIDKWKLPWETVRDKSGDCDDMSILLASILRCMGYDAILVGCLNHCIVGVYMGDGCEHTVSWNGKEYGLVDPQNRDDVGEVDFGRAVPMGAGRTWLQAVDLLILSAYAVFLTYCIVRIYEK